ncbi:exonuclease domain-containing protein [Croceivirga thetidis]|uniref:exonuclease domain-containing protein n=1 Tax=Croceivirga thetidis TaxID=2721623 RepID=UPI001B2FF525|nr:exonuclease domain-containing protein [Croceivirga thetidis]
MLLCSVLYTIIDIETTGNGLKGNKITEISIFKFDGEQVVDEFTSLVNPQCPIPFFITGLTGIDDQTVAKAPIFEEIAPKVLELTEDCIFVAHAVNFDYGVIKEEFRQLGVDFVRKKLCTVRLSRKLIPGLRSYSLGKLCSAINIPITDRHRARGDAHATVLLFQQLLQKPDSEKVIATFLNARSQEATLPPNLDRAVINGLPNQPGVYYFYGKNQEIIYVGKAKNLKKRVLGHFYDKSEHEIRLCREIEHIEYTLSGSEIIALLMESAAIKKNWPKYNRAQKRRVKQYGIFSYEDRRGLIHLGYGPLSKTTSPLQVFNSVTDCRAFLTSVCNAYSLCPKYCQLLDSKIECSKNMVFECSGVCENKESVQDYNERAAQALLALRKKEETLFLKEKGRTPEEDAILYLKDGQYMGYGFVPKTATISTDADLEPFIELQTNTRETQLLVESYLQKSAVVI